MSYELSHYGMPRRSGRYPYGSGENPFQHESDFLHTVRELRDKGFSEKEIYNDLGISSTEYRKQLHIARVEEAAAIDSEILRLKDKGWSNQAIADRIGKNESYVRNRINPIVQQRQKKTNDVVNVLKENTDSNNYIDIGPGAESALGISRTKLINSVAVLEKEGYVRETIYVDQLGNPGKKTAVQVLAKPGTSVQDIYENKYDISVLGGVKGSDGGKTNLGIQKPVSVDSKRILVRYNEEGGAEKDGVIEIRRNVEDLKLGNSNYAQVRIAVDDTHYMKGMAMYSDDIPKGYDIVYNSHRSLGTPLFKKDAEHPETVFKKMKEDEDNPFGTTLKMEKGVIVGQQMYKDKDGKEKLSPINIVREQGDWDTWSKTLASQFLSKQPIQLIKQQLKITYDQKEDEFNEIKALTNPIVKQKLLDSFASDCDASAVHLKAAALPRQSSKVILPFNDIKETEIYAPTYKDGEEVILIRYPHGGTFEIPRLIVNNKVKSAKGTIGQANDAVGINAKTASILSGADFDGDTVVVIPTSGQKIKTQNPLDDLKDFDPQEAYAMPKGLSESEIDKLTMKNTQNEMGRISNLITDMTIQGATNSELARAVKHSMVVIDAEKHHLDYKRSYTENGIAALKEKYQGGGGASTIISRAKSQVRLPDRNPVYSVTDKEGNTLSRSDIKDYVTGKKDPSKLPEEAQAYIRGEKLYRETGKTSFIPVKDKSGNIIGYKEELKTIKSSKMAETKDAYSLVSGNSPKEEEFAEYANKLKALANESRRESLAITTYKRNESAVKTYAKEIESLESKLTIAKMNKPLERKAQTLANVIVESKIKDNPEIRLDMDSMKKVKTQALSQARNMTGASKIDSAVNITDKEWEAIQAGAISSQKLKEIIDNTDQDRLKQLATPRDSKELTNGQIARIKNYAKYGYTQSEIADALGISATTVNKYIG